jgi:hypothetical protein
MFSAYLNQDFDLMFGTADEAIRAFMRQSARDEVSAVVHDIQAILSMKLSEGDLQKRILQDLGSCYYYPAEWPSAELWLIHVLELLRS